MAQVVSTDEQCDPPLGPAIKIMLSFLLLGLMMFVARSLRTRLSGTRFLVSSCSDNKGDSPVSAEELHKGMISTWRNSRVIETAIVAFIAWNAIVLLNGLHVLPLGMDPPQCVVDTLRKLQAL